MELKEHKSALAALATLGVTAVAAGATAIVKIRKKRKQREREQQADAEGRLTVDQMMVYNEAVRAFITLNNRIYELRQYRDELQPLINWLANDSEQPEVKSDHEELKQLADEIDKFLTTQLPFINACISNVTHEEMTYVDCVHAPVKGAFDNTLDEEPTGDVVEPGTPIKYVLKLGYFFPESTIAIHPIKSIVLV